MAHSTITPALVPFEVHAIRYATVARHKSENSLAEIHTKRASAWTTSSGLPVTPREHMSSIPASTRPLQVAAVATSYVHRSMG